jgi:FixJ family two-component response regulator
MHLADCSQRRSCTIAGTPAVFVVDADASVRGSLDALIRSAGWQPRTAAYAEEFLAHPRIDTAACLLVNLDLPGLSGLDLLRVVADRVAMPIILMSGHIDTRATVRAMKCGAFEFLTKPLERHVLLDAIRDAIERSDAAKRRAARVQALQERYESLSRREREVMSLVVSGRLNKQVGGDPGISEITVKAHRGRMMRKMQAHSFAELVHMAASLGRDASTDALDFEPLSDGPFIARGSQRSRQISQPVAG